MLRKKICQSIRGLSISGCLIQPLVIVQILGYRQYHYVDEERMFCGLCEMHDNMHPQSKPNV